MYSPATVSPQCIVAGTGAGHGGEQCSNGTGQTEKVCPGTIGGIMGVMAINLVRDRIRSSH